MIPTSPLAYRPATPADCEAAAALINSAYRGESSKAGWTTEEHLLEGKRTDAEGLRELIAKPGNTLLLAFEADGRLVGTVQLESRPRSTCYLGMFTVLPTSQARGYGKAFLAEAERFARDRYGSSEMEMAVITVRHELLAWYERRGYKRTGKRIPFDPDPRYEALKVSSLEFEVLKKAL